MVWNLREYGLFKKTEAYQTLKNSNNEATLMAIPLTLAMSVNVLFILAVIFIPNLWTYIEYLFPVAIFVFLSIGVYALKIFTEYFIRLLVKGDFNFISNNSFTQMIVVFAFSTITVGFTAPAAMSHHITTSAIAMFFAILFGTITFLFGALGLLFGFNSILSHSVAKEGSPSLWISIPIITLLTISSIRIYFAISHNFLHIQHPTPIVLFVLLSISISLQLLFGILGYIVMERINYFSEYVDGPKKNPGSFSLICPGVAFFVLGMFFVHYGLVQNGVITKFSLAYFLILIPIVMVQLMTISTLFKLRRKLLSEHENRLEEQAITTEEKTAKEVQITFQEEVISASVMEKDESQIISEELLHAQKEASASEADSYTATLKRSASQERKHIPSLKGVDKLVVLPIKMATFPMRMMVKPITKSIQITKATIEHLEKK